MRTSRARAGDDHPGFVATTVRIVWVLLLTATGVVGTILWSASATCELPCRIEPRPPLAALERPR